MDEWRVDRSAGARARLLRHRLRTLVVAHDGYLAYLRVSPKWRNNVVRRTTEIVIEGYPRSGNTFAQVAFELAQGRPVHMGHHTHAPVQVRWAVRHRIPMVLLIRQPEDAIVSHVIRDPYLPLEVALQDWIRFHQLLAPWRDQLLVAEFGKVISDFGEITRLVNQVYGTHFAIFENSKENVARCYRAIDELSRRHWRQPRIDEVRVARPSEVRAPLKEVLRSKLLVDSISGPLRQAHTLYQEFLDGHPVVP